MSTRMRMPGSMSTARRHQIPLKLEIEGIMSHPSGYCELNSGPLQEHDAESSLQALLATFLICHQNIQFNEVPIVNSVKRFNSEN